MGFLIANVIIFDQNVRMMALNPSSTKGFRGPKRFKRFKIFKKYMLKHIKGVCSHLGGLRYL